MALINRIEIVNYLCEGWEPSMGIASWQPLWPANVINLCGASTAVQVPNGGGKTSVTNAVLYLLSQDRVLKQRFLERCSPAGMVATHIRIEFALLHDQDLTQRDLMTAEPQYSLAETVVIGVCANRGDERPRFYRYSGTLEDVPACQMDGTSIEFTPAAALQAYVKNIKGQWDNWNNAAEWGKVVGLFMSPDVVRQNVMFHRDGAGDASAAFSKVKASSAERFDEAYFRQVVAPQLLTNVMGDSAQEDERNVEDTILKSMGTLIDAKLQVEGKEAYLKGREALEIEFRPVLDAARKIEITAGAYQTQLQTLAVDAAFLARFARSREARMPGVPRTLDEVSMNAKVRDCLKAMVLDKDGSVLIESSGLAVLLNLKTGRLNEIADRSSASLSTIPSCTASSQAIDLYCDIKDNEGRGGQRKALRFYELRSARELASRQFEDASDLHAILDQAFDLAKTSLDTNVFRHNLVRLQRNKVTLKQEIAQAQSIGEAAEAERELLEKQVTEWQENQGAYQEFCEQLHLIPTELHESPTQVQEWLTAETRTRTEAVSAHNLRVGKLTNGWEELEQVRAELGLVAIEDQISDLNTERVSIEKNKTICFTEASNAQTECNQAAALANELHQKIAATAVKLGTLSEHMQAYDRFITIFGEVDPLTVSPPIEENEQLESKKQQLETQRRTKSQEYERLQHLSNATTSFKQLFGDIDPRVASPQRDHQVLLEAQSAAQAMYSQHQPLAESLEKHLERTGLDPAAWLHNTDAAHAAAVELARATQAIIGGLDRELAALDDLDQVGNADYAAAHNALEDASLDLTRVLNVILDLQLPKEDSLPLLAALSPLLDAPVATDIDRAKEALAVLQQGDYDVPVLLLDPLVELLSRGPDQDTSTVASLGIFAGAKSRRMQAIVDPQALIEEREGLVHKRDEQQARHDAALTEAQLHTPHTDAYRQALRAQEAINQRSVEKVNAAKTELAALEKRLVVAKRLTTPEALSLLHDAKRFVDAGGDDALTILSIEIEELAGGLVTVEERLTELSPRLTQQAIVAHDGARRFVNGGGHQTFKALQENRTSLEGQLSNIDAAMPELQAKLTRYQSDLQQAINCELVFMSNFQTTLDRLMRAEVFESDGSAAFMEKQAHTLVELEALRDALNPLRSLNYPRVQAFKQHQGEDEVALHRQIAETKARRAEAVAKVLQLSTKVESLEGEIVEARLAAEALHELAYFLCNRRNAAAPFEDDLRSRETGDSRAESHDAYDSAEKLLWQLSDWRPDRGYFDRSSIGMLRGEVEAIDVARTGKDIGEARKNATRAKAEFERVRETFCSKARASSDGGFSEAEIEAIQNANTSEQLSALANISSRLREQLKAEQEELEELKQSTAVIESASNDALTRVVESCKTNLSTMNSVMAKNPKARFMIEAEVISTEDIRRLMQDLRDHIEGHKREAKSRQKLSRSSVDTNLGADIRRALIDRIFIKPSVQFVHVGMWDGKTRPVQSGVSEGQKSALQMLWLIRESEYHLECAVRRHLGGGSKKKLRSRSQRVLFFDGLFSNLTDRRLIDEAFKGLGDADSSLQLIGLIHNPEYRNNSKIFPSYVVGRRVGNRDVEGERSYVRFEDGRPEGSMGLATFMHKRQPPTTSEATNG